MPILGLGTWDLRGKEASQAVLWALEIGYRHIDTASMYGNEKTIGEALKESKIPRDEIFITTKVWTSDQGYENTLVAFDKSRELLNNIPEEWGGVWELGGKENGCDLFVCFWRYR